ncbi:MAG: DHH family phosphoesterase [Candidatus Micrarchaeota archaeon]|nr:DHH family phosphoesterase [Candidatus Micrarchaeota archaeon]
MIFDENALEKLKKIFSSDGKKVLVYHRDADGVTSAAQLMKFFSGFTTICREGPIIDDKFIRQLSDINPESITFVDIPADQHYEKLQHLLHRIEGVKISVIDHHPFERDLNELGMVHINNMLLDEYKNMYMPASCIIWKMLSAMGFESERYSWIAGIGVIGDYGTKDCPDVIESVRRKDPKLVEGDIMASTLSKGAEMISASITVKGVWGAGYSLRKIVASGSFYDFISDNKLSRWHEMLSKEIKRITEDFEKNGKKDDGKGSVIYEIKSDFSISSVISSLISEKYPNMVVIIYKKWDNMYKVSLRCQDGHVDVGSLAKAASAGIGSGGGHRKAAGALVKDINGFIKEVTNALEVD